MFYIHVFENPYKDECTVELQGSSSASSAQSAFFFVLLENALHEMNGIMGYQDAVIEKLVMECEFFVPLVNLKSTS